MRVFAILAMFIGFSVASNARHADVYFKGFAEYWFDANNEIQVTFDLACDEQLLQVIRQETYDVESGITTIHLGALVERNLEFCNGNYEYHAQSFSAGFAYSGIAFRIDEINSGWYAPVVPVLPPWTGSTPVEGPHDEIHE
jgi:hypothetical protein